MGEWLEAGRLVGGVLGDQLMGGWVGEMCKACDVWRVWWLGGGELHEEDMFQGVAWIGPLYVDHSTHLHVCLEWVAAITQHIYMCVQSGWHNCAIVGCASLLL